MVYEEPYRASLKEAEQRGEDSLFWKSYNTDNYCKMAIDTAINRGYDGRSLEAFYLRGVIRDYGLERVERLLANTIRQREKEGRFSRENQAWAKTVSVPECRMNGYDLWREFALTCDGGLVNLAADIVRREREQEREAGNAAGNKPSIREQLAKTSCVAQQPAGKRYAREVR